MAFYDSQGKSKFMFGIAIFISLLLSYFVQTCCFFIWQKLVFPHFYPQELSDLYFAYLNFIEFTWFVFGRTRLTLKYYPKIITILNVTFLVYINSYKYAASTQLLQFIICLNALILTLFLH